jgi:hypothetical protein
MHYALAHKYLYHNIVATPRQPAVIYLTNEDNLCVIFPKYSITLKEL